MGLNGNGLGIRPPEAIHGGSVNICFLDGHLERRTMAEVPTYNANTDYNSKIETDASIFWLGR